MRDGLKIIQLTSGYSWWATTLIGWVRRVSGDEYEIMPGARVLWRQRGDRDANGLDYAMSPPSEGVEEINRLTVRRVRPANEDMWAKHCPRPKDWRGE